MTLNELYDKSMERWKSFDIHAVLPALERLNDGAMQDVLNTNGCRYYQLFPCLFEELKPKQVVELGGAMGVASIMMLNSKYQDFQLYSITLAEGGLEFSYVKDSYPNFHPLIGDDLDLSNFDGVDLSKTDFFFFDALHTYDQLTKELDLYSPFFKKGTIVVFDDIRSFGLWPIWEDIVKGKWGFTETKEITNPCHYSGFGIAKI